MTGAVRSPSGPPPDVIEQAIGWAARLRCRGGADDSRALAAWRAAAPEHEAAWQSIQDLLDPGRALPANLAQDRLWAGLLSRRPRGRRGLLGALVLATAAPFAIELWRDQSGYRTQVGAQRTIDLDGAGTLLMNTDTHLDLPEGVDAARIVLQRGEIFVHAPGGAAVPRPLDVAIPQGRVSMIAGQLGVRTHDRYSTVSVEQGRAMIQAGEGGAARPLDPGQSVQLFRDGIRPIAFEGPAAQRWTAGVYTARAMRLADLVAELARYRRGWVSCAAAVGDRLVSGVYQLRDIDGTLRFLADTQGLVLAHRGPLWVHLHDA